MSPTTFAPRPGLAPTPAWTFPAPQRFTLSNGAAVQHFRMPGQLLVSVEMLLAADIHDEPQGLEGVCGVAADAVLEGPNGYDSAGFARAVAAFGADLRATATSEGTQFSVSASTNRIRGALDLLAQALRDPRLDPGDIARLVALRLDELAIVEIDPTTRARHALARAYFPADRRERLPETGTVETLRAVRSGDVEAFVRGSFAPRDALVVIAGDLDADTARDLLESTLGTWTAGGGARRSGGPLEQGGRGLVLVDMPDSVQTHLALLAPSLLRDDPRWADAVVAVHALGGSMESMLNLRLREEKGLTYGVTGALRPTRHLGCLLIETSVDAETTEEAVRDVLDVVDTLRRDGLDADEHARCVEELTAGGALGFERAHDIAATAIDMARWGLPDGWPTLERERIRATTPDSVRAALPALGLDALLLVAAGDVSAHADALSSAGLGAARTLPDPTHSDPDPDPRRSTTGDAMTTTRPVLPEDELTDLNEQELAQIRQEFDEECARLEKRGPVTLHLGEGHSGYFTFGGMVDASGAHTLSGTHEFDTYTPLPFAQMHNATSDFFTSVPVEHFDFIEILGCDDDAFRALAQRPHLHQVDVTAVVTQEMVDAIAALVAEEVEADAAEAAAAAATADTTADAATGDDTGDDAGEAEEMLASEPLPTPGGSLISGPALLTMSAHPELTDLRVTGTTASDEQIRELLEALPALEAFGVTSDEASFSDLSFLGGREELAFLGIGGPRLTGAGVATLPHLPQVTMLLLTGDDLANHIDGAALKAAVPALELLVVRDSAGKQASLQETLRLRHALPGLELNDATYGEKALAKLAKKFGIDLTSA